MSERDVKMRTIIDENRSFRKIGLRPHDYVLMETT